MFHVEHPVGPSDHRDPVRLLALWKDRAPPSGVGRDVPDREPLFAVRHPSQWGPEGVVDPSRRRSRCRAATDHFIRITPFLMIGRWIGQ
jgi:hypothetical protein